MNHVGVKPAAAYVPPALRGKLRVSQQVQRYIIVNKLSYCVMTVFYAKNSVKNKESDSSKNEGTCITITALYSG